MSDLTVFERVIPFPQRLQWLMLKTALDENISAETIADRLAWSREKVWQHVWGYPGRLKIDGVAEWFFACGGGMPKLGFTGDTP